MPLRLALAVALVAVYLIVVGWRWALGASRVPDGPNPETNDQRPDPERSYR
jgi:hypothetical protein